MAYIERSRLTNTAAHVDFPVAAATTIDKGQAVATDVNGNVIVAAAAATNLFSGFAYSSADNSAGSAGDLNVTIENSGYMELSVTGVTGAADRGSVVYCNGADSFDLTNGGDYLTVGKVYKHITGTTVLVKFVDVSV